MATIPKLSTNVFSTQTSYLGRLALAINNTRVVAGRWNGVAAYTVGDRVKIDGTITTPGAVNFLPAADNELAFGAIVGTVREGTGAQGDDIEVAFSGGMAMTQIAGGTLTPGTPVARSAGFLAAVDGTHLQMGILLDYVTISTPGRVIIGWVAC